MSAFMSVAAPNEICILTDGASYTPAGVVVEIGRKIMASDRVPLAITTRGAKGAGDRLAAKVIEKAEADGVDAMVDFLEGWLTIAACGVEMADWLGVHLHIAAFSPTKGLVRLSGHNLPKAFSDGEVPCQLHYITGPYTAGTPTSAETLAAQRVAPMEAGEAFSAYLRRMGPAIFEAMRRTPAVLMAYEEQPKPQFIIGGQLDLTVVTPDGVSIESLRRWPDAIGEKIDPDRRGLLQRAAGG